MGLPMHENSDVSSKMKYAPQEVFYDGK